MKKITNKVVSVLSSAMYFSLFLTLMLTIYSVGYKFGYIKSQVDTYKLIEKSSQNSAVTIQKGGTKIIYVTPEPVVTKPALKWGGPELWEAVNKRRIEFGVNGMSSKEELCTIASIRLNQLLELGKLDGHEGFGKLPESRPDIKWIFDKYNLSEFLVSGADSPTEAVSLWENTLGHKKLLTGGEYVWGCIYAQNGFGVAIAAY